MVAVTGHGPGHKQKTKPSKFMNYVRGSDDDKGHY